MSVTSLQRMTALWPYLVDEKVGIIRKVSDLPCDADDPECFHTVSLACDTSVFTSLKNFSHNGGVSTDRAVSVAKALGEAVERYCAAIFRYKDLTFAPFRALPRRATPPESYALFLPKQYAAPGFRWRPFTDDASVAWTEGRSLVTGAPILVPAARVFVPYHYRKADIDTPFTQPISTGLACGCSYEEAAVSGLCEVIERDAFTLTWQARLNHPSIRHDTIPASARDLVQRFRDVRIDVKILDITTDVAVPTFMTIALSDATSSPAVAIAAATDPSPETALRKSLEELVHTRKYAKQVMQYMPPAPVDVEGGHPEIQERDDHLRFYCPQDARPFIDFAWKNSPSRSFAESVSAAGGGKAAELERLTGLLHARGLEPVSCDLTTPDVAELGLKVVRAVIPGMHPLSMGYQNRALGGRRLYEVPQLLGFPGLKPGEPDNPYPHPFP
jgi:ribosomal protein S12 methylthiotransferase accessory factor